MEAASGATRYSGFSGVAGYIVIAITGLTAWWLLSRVYPLIVPSPLESISYLAENAGLAARDMVNTLVNTVLGFTAALILAVALGGAAAFSGRMKPVVDSLNVVVQSVSALVWAIAFLLVFGFTSRLSSVGVAAATPTLLSLLVKPKTSRKAMAHTRADTLWTTTFRLSTTGFILPLKAAAPPRATASIRAAVKPSTVLTRVFTMSLAAKPAFSAR